MVNQEFINKILEQLSNKKHKSKSRKHNGKKSHRKKKKHEETCKCDRKKKHRSHKSHKSHKSLKSYKSYKKSKQRKYKHQPQIIVPLRGAQDSSDTKYKYDVKPLETTNSESTDHENFLSHSIVQSSVKTNISDVESLSCSDKTY